MDYRGRIRIAWVGKWIQEVAENLERYLVGAGYHVDCRRVRHLKLWEEKRIFVPHSVVISHLVGTRSFGCLETRDSVVVADDLTPVLKNPSCFVMMKCQYKKNASYPKIQPYVYFPKEPHRFDAILDDLRMERASKKVYDALSPNLYFRGLGWKHRQFILENITEILTIPASDQVSIPIDEYYNELASAEVALSLPGQGNVCHREIECFGIGVPVIMPKHGNQMKDPLIPGKHYIGVDKLDNEHLDLAVENIKAAYHKAKSEPHRLEEIAANAMEWYDRNVRYPNDAKVLAQAFRLEAWSQPCRR